MTSENPKITMKAVREKSLTVPSDDAMQQIAAIGKQLVDLSVQHNILPWEVFARLGYSTGTVEGKTNQPDTPKTTDNQQSKGSSATTTPKKKKSKKKRKSGAASLTEQNVKENKDSLSSSRKRQSTSGSNPTSKKQRLDNANAPKSELLTLKDRIVPVGHLRIKEKYSLSSCPVTEGLRDKDGIVKERPQGGPYGLAEWLMTCLDSQKGLAQLEKRKVAPQQAKSALRVLFCFIGANSPTDLAFLCRFMDGNRIDEIFGADFNGGLEILQDAFKFSGDDLKYLNDHSSFRKKDFRDAWFQEYSKYLRVVEEQARKRLEKVNSNSMEVETTTLNTDDIPFGNVTGGKKN